MEIIQSSMISQHEHYLPLIDTAVSFLMASYLFGTAVIDIWTNIYPHAAAPPYFHLAVGFVIFIAIIMYYLDKTRSMPAHIKGTFLVKKV
jgi:hypothetical protein